MATAIVSEDRNELNKINPIISGALVDTLEQVRCAVAFLGQFHNHAGMGVDAVESSTAAHHGAALLCACVDVALQFERAELSVIRVELELKSSGVSSDTVSLSDATHPPKKPNRQRGNA